MRKISFFPLLILVSVGFLWAAGQSDDSAAAGGVTVNPAGTLPIVDETVELEVMMAGAAQVEDYQTNAYTLWLEEQTNVKVQYSVVFEDNIADKLNITLAGGSYPDVFLSMGITPTQEVLYGEQGIFLNLKELVDEYAPNFLKVLEEFPSARSMVVHGDGDIFGLVNINKCFHCDYGQKAWIYYPWLEQLGLDVPTTTDEFVEVLKAFRDGDPNGNGIADEIPIAGSTTGWNAKPDGFLMKPFVYNDMLDRLIVSEGAVRPVYTTPEWKEGLRFMKMLYDEGLLAGESFTQTVQGLRQMANNPDAHILGAAIFGAAGGAVRPNTDLQALMVAIPPLEGPDGTRWAFYNAFQGIRTGDLVITNAAENPEVALRWGDFMYTEDANMRAVYGVPGVDWREATVDDGADLRGRPAKFFRLTLFGAQQNSHWMQKGLNVRTYDLRQSWAFDFNEDAVVAPSPYNGQGEQGLYNSTKDLYEPYGFPFEWQLPPLDFTEVEAEILADTRGPIKDYVEEALARFVTGDMDIDADWNSYLSELDAIGLDEMLDAFQGAFDRKSF